MIVCCVMTKMEGFPYNIGICKWVKEYWLLAQKRTMLDKVGHLDFLMLYLCRRTQEWFPRYLCNKPQVSQIKSTNLCLQLSHQTSQAGFNRRTMGLRLPPDLLSFVSRSSLVRPSFVLRSSFVRYSLVYRRRDEKTAQLDGNGSFLVSNVKPNEQNRACSSYAMARKGAM